MTRCYRINSCLLDCVLAKREVSLTVYSPRGLQASLVLGQTATDGAGLLYTKIERSVLQGSIMLTKSALLGLVDHSQHTSNVLAYNFDLGQLRCGSTGYLCHAQHGQLSLELI